MCWFTLLNAQYKSYLSSCQVAEELIADAKLQLQGYDQRKAAPLLAMADYIYSRTN